MISTREFNKQLYIELIINSLSQLNSYILLPQLFLSLSYGLQILLFNFYKYLTMDKDFWIKVVLRVLKIASLIGVSHKAITDYQAGQIGTQNTALYTVLGLVLIASSIINTFFVMKPQKMGEKKKLWVGFHHLKLTITLILYLPIAKWIMSGSTLASFRFYWIGAVIVLAPFMRFYRQHYSDKTRI